MLNVTAPLNVDQYSCQINLLVVTDNHWVSAQNTISMLHRRKSVITVPHVPVHVFQPLLKSGWVG